jgi:hypothetical protein
MFEQRRRHDGSSGIDVALGALAPIAAGAALVAVRDRVDSVNIALALTVVVVLSGALGGRGPGMASALTAAVSFDFFHTRPYLSVLIHDADDVEMTILLLVLGLISGQLASWARRTARLREGERNDFDRIRRLADQVAQGADAADVIGAARDELLSLFELVDCQFEPAPFRHRLDMPRLERNGVVANCRYRVQPNRDLELEVPAEGLMVPVLARGQIVGRFVLDFAPEAGATLEQRVVAIALADQVGAALIGSPAPTGPG